MPAYYRGYCYDSDESDCDRLHEHGSLEFTNTEVASTFFAWLQKKGSTGRFWLCGMSSHDKLGRFGQVQPSAGAYYMLCQLMRALTTTSRSILTCMDQEWNSGDYFWTRCNISRLVSRDANLPAKSPLVFDPHCSAYAFTQSYKEVV